MTTKYEGERSSFAIKMVILGNYATGKTTLVSRLTTGKMRPFTESTIGCAFSSINRPSKHGTPVQYQIWDTAGQEKYRAMTELYYRNADIIIICFDVGDPASFRDINIWLDLINDGCQNSNHIRFLIANKDDLDWRVNRHEVEEISKNNNLNLVVTSSLLNRGISELLETIIDKTEIKWKNELKQFKDTHLDTRIRLDKPLQKKINCCY